MVVPFSPAAQRLLVGFVSLWKQGTCSGALLLPWPLCPGQRALQLAPSLAA